MYIMLQQASVSDGGLFYAHEACIQRIPSPFDSSYRSRSGSNV